MQDLAQAFLRRHCHRPSFQSLVLQRIPPYSQVDVFPSVELAGNSLSFRRLYCLTGCCTGLSSSWGRVGISSIRSDACSARRRVLCAIEARSLEDGADIDDGENYLRPLFTIAGPRVWDGPAIARRFD